MHKPLPDRKKMGLDFAVSSHLHVVKEQNYFLVILTSKVLPAGLPFKSNDSDFTSPTPLAYHSVTRTVVVFNTTLVRFK